MPEIVHEHADGEKPFMGMQTTRPGGVVRKADAAIAKNYPTEPELQVLLRIVNLYIEFAELQALERQPMTMRDWVDEFLKASGRKLLDHAGTVSAEVAKAKAERESARSDSDTLLGRWLKIRSARARQPLATARPWPARP